MVEPQAKTDPRAAIVARERELHMPERLHDLHRVAGHFPLRIGVALLAVGRRRPAIAAQIHRHDGKTPCEGRRDFMPGDMGLAETVQQQERRPGAVSAHEDFSRLRVDPMRGETREEIG